jgi:hypothetical protein
MSVFWALSEVALHGGGASGTSEGSTICYFKGKAPFWATRHMFWRATHFGPLFLNQATGKILKTFLASHDANRARNSMLMEKNINGVCLESWLNLK